MSLFQSQTTPRISVEYTKRVHETNHHRHALLLEMFSVGIKKLPETERKIAQGRCQPGGF